MKIAFAFFPTATGAALFAAGRLVSLCPASGRPSGKRS